MLQNLRTQAFWKDNEMLKKVKITSMDMLVGIMTPVIESGKSVKFTVVGNSMYPLFRDGIETVTMVKADNIKKYDVILYRREEGSYVLHRVVGVGKDGYKLCGDNQLVIEYPVKQSSVIAVMTEFERKGKTVEITRLWYVLYSRIWCVLLPLRPFMFKTAKIVKRLLDL